MSILTKRERDGLEDVFMAIHSNNDISFKLAKLLKHAKIGLKKAKSSSFFIFSHKKKKYLSK